MFSSFHCGCCSSDCLLGYVTGSCIKFSRSFPRNITIHASELLNLIQVGFEVIVRRNRVGCMGILQGLLAIRAADSEEEINIKKIQINHQLDATISPLFYLTFIYSSTCFGRPHVHHQELNNCNSSLWFYHWSVVVAMLLVVVGPADPTTTNSIATTTFQR